MGASCRCTDRHGYLFHNRMESDVFVNAVASLITWNRAKQTEDEEQRRLTRNRRVVAAGLRLQKLRETWKQRKRQQKLLRLQRLCAHNIQMQEITDQFLRQCSPRKQRVWFYPRTSDWWESVGAFTDAQWLQHFRVSKDTFSFLCGALRPQLKRQDTTYRLCIPLQKRVALALYKLANACDYKTVADLFAVGVASVCRCVREFCAAAVEVLQPQLIAEPSHAGLKELADHFYQRYGVPQCVGVIGSILIPIIRPPHHVDHPGGDGHLAIMLQAVVDGNGAFWDVNVSDPEWVDRSTGTGRPWAREGFPDRMRTICGTDADGGLFVLGDEALPPQTWLLRPYLDTGWLTQDQALFNAQVKQASDVARWALARLKGRWHSLSRRMDCNVEVVQDMARTCCLLHNLCQTNADAFLDDWTSEDRLRPDVSLWSS